MIVSFSGIDGSGKSTQLKMLSDYYISKGKKIIKYSELPSTEPYFDLSKYREILEEYDVLVIRGYCRSKEQMYLLHQMANTDTVSEENVLKFQSLFEEDLLKWYKEVIYPVEKQNKIILLDRYAWDDIPYIKKFNYSTHIIENAISKIKGAISFYIKIDSKTMVDRNKNRNDKNKFIFSSIQKIQALIKNYDDIIGLKVDYIIDGRLSKFEIHNKVLEILEMRNML